MKLVDATASGGTCFAATSTPMATARSRPAPTFRTPDGARFTVIRCRGHGSSLDSRRGPYPVPRLATGGIGQADDGEAGQARGDVDLDDDPMTVDAQQRGGRHGGQHGQAPDLRPLRQRRGWRGARGLPSGSQVNTVLNRYDKRRSRQNASSMTSMVPPRTAATSKRTDRGPAPAHEASQRAAKRRRRSCFR